MSLAKCKLKDDVMFEKLDWLENALKINKSI